ncbi:MAG: alanine--tRNA ligase [Rhodothermaceae bacterium]|nr:alanine--tRNA ligase [Bacteroidota bacterium]MXW34019.1 alanine--tRNA ligase [Rhodothermaceae bacterium]MYE62515.1 alanine--tRNA ligase [Rhodothermaceae bacterium]MYJ20804.1 alanine--tRNA ligase [Rhodothermaceae bacterium]
MATYKSTAQIRAEFLEFFREKGHTIVPSASLVPADDPTLLFINSGMAQFKEIFLGQETRSYVRTADTQKCLRVSGKHNDLEEVGHDTYHHTFFEMLGNWSFGDYFKEEAIDMAWELLVNRWKLPEDRLYATVHKGDVALNLAADEEAATLWRRYLPENQVLYGSTKDNFWMMGETGPCGPCSEIHIDLRPDELRQQIPGHECVNQDLPTVIELWNLVFIQYDAQVNKPSPNKSTSTDTAQSPVNLLPLTARHVDTGMGLERLAAVMQGKISTYDTDAFRELLDQLAELTPISGIRGYDDIDSALDIDAIRVAMRVVVDHIRGIVVAVADGVVPGNVGRGYVIRRILRRAVRYGYTTLKIKEPFLCCLVPVVIESLAEIFPELRTREKLVTENIRGEERAFLHTLGRGLALFDRVCDYIDGVTSEEEDAFVDQLREDASARDLLRKAYASTMDRAEPDEMLRRFVSVVKLSRIPGEVAFLLHDTYGFPIDLTQLMARERGRRVDMSRFEELMTEQRHRARSAKSTEAVAQSIGKVDGSYKSEFVGYEQITLEGAQVIASDEDAGVIVLDRSPFYAEKGGQIGDTGILNFDGEVIQVTDTQIVGSQIAHRVERFPSTLKCPVTAIVDAERRHRIAKHHTATHLMHAALREVLGPGAEQRGSLVAEGHLRFDFNHYERVSVEDLRHVQDRVNEQIQRNIAAEIDPEVRYREALARGATALFGEKYGDVVRVVTFDPAFSVELCAGTHVQATGEIGLFILQSEGSIATGVRRVEAIAGVDAVDMVTRERTSLEQTRRQFRGLRRPVEESVAELLEANRLLQKEVEKLRHERLSAQLDGVLDSMVTVDDIHLATGQIDDADMDMLRAQGQELRQRLNASSVGILGARDPGGQKAYLVAVVTDDLLSKGVNAGKIAGHFARQIGGGGGGRPELATAGGREPEKLGAVLENAPELIRSVLPASA